MLSLCHMPMMKRHVGLEALKLFGLRRSLVSIGRRRQSFSVRSLVMTHRGTLAFTELRGLVILPEFWRLGRSLCPVILSVVIDYNPHNIAHER